MNPMTVAQNRTARLAAEAATPVYSTSTPPAKPREHLMAVETDGMWGRHWSTMKESEVGPFIDRLEAHDGEDMHDYLSDVDHAAACWCFK